ncbi:MAG: S-layer homology domain-containing protein [Acidimicrobiaceae bacterium]|nr:S-layer homology domain-containing protein [Acidimicrobiaceae bacterium]
MRGFLLGLTAASMVGGVFAAPTPAQGVAGFGDVDEDRYFASAVQWMVDNDITTGTSEACFSPDDPVPRGQGATFLWRMEGEPDAPAHGFDDVVAPYQQGAVSWLAGMGPVVGAIQTEFYPDRTLSRGEFAAMLHRVAGRPAARMHPFTDVTAPWQHQPVAWMAAESITTGTSATAFSPDDAITRGELATFLYRYKGSPGVELDPDGPRCQPPSDVLRLTRVGEIRGAITPKSVVYSGVDLFFAQNMMYRHTITVYDRSMSLVGTISDRVVLSDFGVAGADPGASYSGAPVEAAFTSDGRYAYVSNYQMFGPGYSRPGGDSCSPGAWDNSFLYRVDVESLTIDQVIGVGPVPKFVAVTPDDSKVLVTNWCGYDLSVIDVSTATESARVPIGRFPRGIAVTSDSSTAYIAVMGGRDIAVVDLDNLGEPLSWIKGVGTSPRSLVLSADDRFLFATLNHGGGVVKIDLESKAVVGKVSTGAGPRSMSISDDGTAVFVVNYHSDTLSKVRTSDMVELQRIATPDLPIGVTYDPLTRRVWVATYSGTIQIYEDTLL